MQFASSYQNFTTIKFTTYDHRTYLDYAAATPLDPAVASAMQPYQSGVFANPSSSHAAGRGAAAAVERARSQVARFIRCGAAEVVFTSGATEANNLALLGIAPRHLVVSAIEHPSVAEPAAELGRRGSGVTTVAASRSGYVSAAKIVAAIRPQTGLVSLQYVNGETGAVQPVAEVAKLIAKVNRRRQRGKLPPVLLHTDAVQAAPWLSCDVRRLGVDLLSLSAHKVYGPKGVGCLFVRSGVQLRPLLLGGGQEGGRRAGTVNVAGVVGMGAAVALLGTPAHARMRRAVAALRASALRQLRPLGYIATGVPSRTAPGHLHLRRPGLPADVALSALDLAGIAASAGTACAAGATLASPALRGMGWSSDEAAEAFRITLGRGTTADDVAALVAVLRRLARFAVAPARRAR